MMKRTTSISIFFVVMFSLLLGCKKKEENPYDFINGSWHWKEKWGGGFRTYTFSSPNYCSVTHRYSADSGIEKSGILTFTMKQDSIIIRRRNDSTLYEALSYLKLSRKEIQLNNTVYKRK